VPGLPSTSVHLTTALIVALITCPNWKVRAGSSGLNHTRMIIPGRKAVSLVLSVPALFSIPAFPLVDVRHRAKFSRSNQSVITRTRSKTVAFADLAVIQSPGEIPSRVRGIHSNRFSHFGVTTSARWSYPDALDTHTHALARRGFVTEASAPAFMQIRACARGKFLIQFGFAYAYTSGT